MKKGILSVCLCVLLSACAMKTGKEIDIQVLAKTFAESSAFEENLNKHTDESAKKIARLIDFDLDEIVLYVGSGALSDKILIVRSDKNTLQKIRELLEKENESLQKSYASYNPAEVVKLESAVLEILNDNTLIYCVSGNSDVIEKEMASYIKGE